MRKTNQSQKIRHLHVDWGNSENQQEKTRLLKNPKVTLSLGMLCVVSTIRCLTPETMAYSSSQGLLTLYCMSSSWLLATVSVCVCLVQLQDNDSLFAASVDGGINRNKGQGERRVCNRVMLPKCWAAVCICGI